MAKNEEKFKDFNLDLKFDPNYAAAKNAADEFNFEKSWQDVHKKGR